MPVEYRHRRGRVPQQGLNHMGREEGDDGHDDAVAGEVQPFTFPRASLE
jgi:hypothetical protein